MSQFLEPKMQQVEVLTEKTVYVHTSRINLEFIYP